MDSPENVRRRLIALRTELGYGPRQQAAFAAAIGMTKTLYNPFEKPDNKRTITLDAACRIRRRFGVPLDWLYLGEMTASMPPVVMTLGPTPKIDEDEALGKAPRRKKKG